MNKKFILIGDGRVAKYHKCAVDYIGGTIICVADPKYNTGLNKKIYHSVKSIPNQILDQADFFVICSGSNLHRRQIILLLKHINSSHKKSQIICEKPAFLPWEMPIDDDRINIVLQLRHLPNLPKKADLVSVQFVRDEAYFKSWKGDAKKTGGLFYNLFIHGIDLAMQLGANFEGKVLTEGDQYRYICKDDELILDLMDIDIQHCYNLLYEDIIKGNGIKPSDLFYLNWILERNSEIYGYGKNGMNKSISIPKELL